MWPSSCPAPPGVYVFLASFSLWPSRWVGARAWGYEFSIDLRTIGQGYQLRRFAADGSNELL